MGSTDNDDDRLDSNITLGSEPLSAMMGTKSGSDDGGGEPDVLGYAVVSTFGDAVIPNDWIEQRMDELGLPEYLVPNKPTPASAYKRAIRRLLNDGLDEFEIDGRTVELEVKNPDDSDSHIRFVEGTVYHPESETATEGGELSHHTLGFFRYDPETQNFTPHMKLDDTRSAHDRLIPIWKRVVNEMDELFMEMQEKNLGEDIRDKSFYYLRTRYTNTVVSLRDAGGIYFFPSQLGETADAMATLASEIDAEWKTGGHKMHIQTMPVFDEEDERRWIEERVEIELNERVDKVIDSAFDKLGDDETAQEIAQRVVDNLDGAFETAQQYNGLLEAELSVEEFIEERLDEVAEEEKEEVLEQVLESGN